MTFDYVFDTYALMEIIQGNNSYFPYINSSFVINNFIFAELCYNLFKDKDKNAKQHIAKFAKYIGSVKPEWIEEAMEFRLKWKDRKVSITDCVGYIMAKNLEIKFLTGDKEFEDMENVEFIK